MSLTDQRMNTRQFGAAFGTACLTALTFPLLSGCGGSGEPAPEPTGPTHVAPPTESSANPSEAEAQFFGSSFGSAQSVLEAAGGSITFQEPGGKIPFIFSIDDQQNVTVQHANATVTGRPTPEGHIECAGDIQKGGIRLNIELRLTNEDRLVMRYHASVINNGVAEPTTRYHIIDSPNATE